jgi:hypothetical protein
MLKKAIIAFQAQSTSGLERENLTAIPDSDKG